MKEDLIKRIIIIINITYIKKILQRKLILRNIEYIRKINFHCISSCGYSLLQKFRHNEYMSFIKQQYKTKQNHYLFIRFCKEFQINPIKIKFTHYKNFNMNSSIILIRQSQMFKQIIKLKKKII